MNAEERKALAASTGKAVEEITTTVEDTSRIGRQRVRRALGSLGSLGTAPMDLIDTHQSGVYALVRGATRATAALAGDLAHRTAPDDAESAVASPRWAPHVAAASAAFGDRLDPALTTSMGLRAHGSLIDVADLSSADTLMVFVHGLGATELQWSPEYLDLGPHVLVRYNSGRPIADNGADLARLLEDVVVATGAQRLVLVGHSMGGLVARSAIAQAQDSQWVPLVSDLVTLGSPHAGAPLERFAARSLAMGQRLRSAEPIIRLGQRRSQGIKDLRFGAMSPGDWHGEIDTEFIDNTAVIELPDHVRHHAVIAVLAPVVGDGMVTPSSAYHRGARSSVVRGGHLSLLAHDEVTDLLREVLTA
jgi:pimeloyl-ACP methyl ester carboxylesterase